MEVKPSPSSSQSFDDDNSEKSVLMKHTNTFKSEVIKSSHGIAEGKPCNASKSEIRKFGNVSKSVVIKPCDAFKAEMMTKTCIASKPKAIKQRNTSEPEVMKPRGFKKLGMKSKEKGRSQSKVNISVFNLLQRRYNLDATLM